MADEPITDASTEDSEKPLPPKAKAKAKAAAKAELKAEADAKADERKRFRDFDTARIARANGRGDKATDPIKFNLAGREWEVIDPLPGSPFLDFVVETDTAMRTKAGKRLFDNVVIAEQRDAFRRAVDEAIPPISFGDIDNILTWVIAEAAGRPTNPS